MCVHRLGRYEVNIFPSIRTFVCRVAWGLEPYPNIFFNIFFKYFFKNTFTNNNVKRPKQVGRTGHLELLTTSSHFGTLFHVIFLTTVPSRGCMRGVYVYVFPWNHASFSMCYLNTTCSWMLLTHVYCHHQEVALLNSSTELNFSLQVKLSSWEQQKNNTLISTSKNCVAFLWLNKHVLWFVISVIAQTQ